MPRIPLETINSLQDTREVVLTVLKSSDYQVQENTPTRVVAIHPRTWGTLGHTVEITLGYQSGKTTLLFAISDITGQASWNVLRKLCKKITDNYEIQECTDIAAFCDFVKEKIGRSLLWQKHEVIADGRDWAADYLPNREKSLNIDGFLILTNQRILFAGLLGNFSRDYALSYGINLEDIMAVSNARTPAIGPFFPVDEMVLLEKSGKRKEFLTSRIPQLVTKINTATAERVEELRVQKEKERVLVVLDFTSLRDVLSKGGIVMTTYKCPNCGGMLDIPEEGKILFCRYCGTPVKPVDIFERIKSVL
ncbi:hypothetical protein MUP77_01220 [Candidatus Bathyarchaeota archaeon]|nr:hypothetical protein [Candidatus Bathyarchaeota archaeon]